MKSQLFLSFLALAVSAQTNCSNCNDNDDDDGISKGTIALVISLITVGAVLICCLVTYVCHYQNRVRVPKRTNSFVSDYNIGDMPRSRSQSDIDSRTQQASQI